MPDGETIGDRLKTRLAAHKAEKDKKLDIVPIQTKELEAKIEQEVAAEVTVMKMTGELDTATLVEKTTTGTADVRQVGYVVTCSHTTPCNCTAKVNKAVWARWNTASTTGWVDDDPWGNWVNATTTVTSNSTTAINHRAWARWITEDQAGRAHRDARYRAQYQQLPPEQKAAEDKRKADYAAARKIEDDRREAERKVRVSLIEGARVKADKLLMSVLNDEQKEELKTKNYFHCKSKQGNRYRIYRGTHGNVKRLNDAGKEIEALCIQPDNVPAEDAMLAQKFHIEFNEEQFRTTANITLLN